MKSNRKMETWIYYNFPHLLDMMTIMKDGLDKLGVHATNEQLFKSFSDFIYMYSTKRLDIFLNDYDDNLKNYFYHLLNSS